MDHLVHVSLVHLIRVAHGTGVHVGGEIGSFDAIEVLSEEVLVGVEEEVWSFEGFETFGEGRGDFVCAFCYGRLRGFDQRGLHAHVGVWGGELDGVCGESLEIVGVLEGAHLVLEVLVLVGDVDGEVLVVFFLEVALLAIGSLSFERKLTVGLNRVQ